MLKLTQDGQSYEYNGGTQPIVKTQEVIKVCTRFAVSLAAGGNYVFSPLLCLQVSGEDPVTITVRHSHYGPIINENEGLEFVDSADDAYLFRLHVPLALHWTALMTSIDDQTYAGFEGARPLPFLSLLLLIASLNICTPVRSDEPPPPLLCIFRHCPAASQASRARKTGRTFKTALAALQCRHKTLCMAMCMATLGTPCQVWFQCGKTATQAACLSPAMAPTTGSRKLCYCEGLLPVGCSITVSFAVFRPCSHIAFADMPRTYNPPEGYIITTNNRITPLTGYSHIIT